MVNVSPSIRQQAHELGQQALANMDPLCEKHLRELEYHPTYDEFSGTAIYRQFENLVYDHADAEGYDYETCDPMIRDELWEEVRLAFDEGYYNPRDTIECVQCLADGDISIRVNDAESISAENILDGKVQSGNVQNDEYDWR